MFVPRRTNEIEIGPAFAILSEEMSEDYVQQCCDKAAEFISRGDDEKAKKYLNKAAARDPENTRVIALLSIIAGRSNKQNPQEVPSMLVCAE